MTRFEWRPATIVENERATAHMIALSVVPEDWIPHLPGQHYEIRFPGEELSRKFSIASAPETSGVLEFGIQVLDYGLLSPRLAAARPGQPLEIRGPTGTGFTWTAETGGPLILLGAGSGITPLLGMYDHHRSSGCGDPVFFLLSATRPERVFRFDRYRNVLTTRFTETAPRMDRAYLENAVGPVLDDPSTSARVCGPKAFMEDVVDALLALGVSETRVRSEGFT